MLEVSLIGPLGNGCPPLPYGFFMRELLCSNCGYEVIHEELGKALYKCQDCGAIRTADVEGKKRSKLRVKLIISELDRTRGSYFELSQDETVKLGEEFAIEEGDEVEIVQLTAIEAAGGKRVKSAKAGEIACLWGKTTSEVSVKFAIQEGGKTRSLRIKVPRDREFIVGERARIAGEEVEITAIKIREGRMRKREGETVPAKNIKRIFSKPARLEKFRRGASPGTE